MDVDVVAVAHAIRPFWSDVRRALAWEDAPVIADSPKVDLTHFEKGMKPDFWLSRSTFARYSSGAFRFLSEEERSILDASVRAIREIAETVDPAHPTTLQQREEALPHFTKLLDVLGFDKYSDPETFVIGKLIERDLSGILPKWVDELLFETEEDSDRNESLWVWIIVDDSALALPTFYDDLKKVENRIKEYVRDLGIELWTYTEVRTVSEQEHLRRPTK